MKYLHTTLVLLVFNAFFTQEINVEKIWKNYEFYGSSVDGFRSMQDGNYFNGGDFQSQDFVFEGENSLELKSENPFGFGFNYEFLKGNEEVVAWVWRYAEGSWGVNGKIVAAVGGKFWKATEEVLEVKENGWEKIQLKFKIPNFLQNELLNIYCWNPNKSPIYFDDFHIVIQELEDL